MKKKAHNTYIYLLYKLLLAFGALEAMQILFHAANSHIFHLETFGEWTGVLWGTWCSDWQRSAWCWHLSPC